MSAKPEKSPVVGASVKKAYSAPVLTVYGSVQSLTLGGGGSKGDVGGTLTMA